MNSIELALGGAARVLVSGLVFGAGLPFVYALAMRCLTIGATTSTSKDGAISVRPSLVGRALAALLIALVVGGVVLGLVIIVASGQGNTVSFDGIIPTIVPKE